MTLTYYDIGDEVRLTGTFRAEPIAPATVGTLTTPTTCVCRVAPSGVAPTTYTLGTSPEMTVRSAGIIDVKFVLTTYDGRAWTWEMIGTGTVNQGAQGIFFVNEEPF